MSRLWIVAYDIADDRRRAGVAACLGETCERVQESVFEGWLAPAAATALATRLRALIDLDADSILLYPVGGADAARRQTLGDMPAATPTPDCWTL